MRCPACKQYVPEGLGLKTCPECHADLTSAPSDIPQSPVTSGKTEPEAKPPLLAAQALAAPAKNSVTRFLFDFGFKRSLRETLGFWLVYMLLGLIVSILFGIVEFKLFHGHVAPILSIKGGQFVAFLESALLAFLILKQKRRFSSFSDILCAALGIFVSLQTGILIGLLIISLLTMRSPRFGHVARAPVNQGVMAAFGSKRKVWFWILGFVVILLISLVLFSGSGRSYYIDSDTTIEMGLPDNRIFQFHGGFFKLIAHYPQDMYASVLGQEVFLRKGGATHYLEMTVMKTERHDLPVRYRVRSIELTNGEKIYPFLLFQTSLYSDETKKQLSANPQAGNLAIREALLQSANLLPKLDFTYSSNLDGLYFGYELKNPPRKLRLSFEIEVYPLGGEPKKVVKETIDLTRVDQDPLDWVKRQTRRRS